MDTAQPCVDVPELVHPVDAEVDMEIVKYVPKQFAIVDEKTANWFVKKVMSARQYGEHVRAFAEQELRRAEREEKALFYLFGRQMETWVKSEIERLKGRRKSICLPGGTVGYRAINPSLHVDNEEAVIIWAKAHCPQAVVLTEKLSRSELKKGFEESGELPDGASLDPGGERFFIR